MFGSFIEKITLIPQIQRYGSFWVLFPYEVGSDFISASADDYLSQECSQDFLNCMASFRASGGRTFNGNNCQVDEVVNVLSLVMEAALLAGRYLHKP